MLPSYVSVSPNGDCSFDTYITHLGSSPSDLAYVGLYQSLSFLFQQALPYIESVFSYSYAMSRLLRSSGSNQNAVALPLRPLNTQLISFRGQKLQVITHIMEYRDDYETKIWHVEGVGYEEIVLTCIYILDDNECGKIEFQRPIAPDEKPFVGDRKDKVKLVPSGNVAASSGRLIVYPNCHATRIMPISSTTTSLVRKHRVVQFHLINPHCRILSTLEESHPRPSSSSRSDRSYARQRNVFPERELEAPVRMMTSYETQYRDDGEFWYH